MPKYPGKGLGRGRFNEYIGNVFARLLLAVHLRDRLVCDQCPNVNPLLANQTLSQQVADFANLWPAQVADVAG
jgi:hypothetical protein